jgi:hypothetical protein
VISGFRHELADNSVLQSCCAPSSGHFLPMFRDKISVPSSGLKNIHKNLFLSPEDGTDMLPRNVCKKLPLNGAEQPRRAQLFSLFSLHYSIVCGYFVTAKDVRALVGLICSRRTRSSKLHLNTLCPDVPIVAEATELSKHQ